MTEAEIQAASKFWSTGPGKAVMEKWAVEWESSDWKACLTRTDNDTWELLLLNDSGNPAFMPPETIEYRCAIDRIHGHYLDMLHVGDGDAPWAFCYTRDSRGYAIEVADEKGWRWRVCEPTLHEALAAAMEAAFGEPT